MQPGSAPRVRPERFGPAMHLRNAAGANVLAAQTAQCLQREADVAHARLRLGGVLTLLSWTIIAAKPSARNRSASTMSASIPARAL
jgi:hypothetical protein